LRDGTTGSLRGSLSVAALGMTGVINGTFALTPSPDGDPLPIVPVEPPVARNEPDNPTSSFNKWLSAYFSAQANLVGAAESYPALWAKDLYSYTRGVAAPAALHSPKPPLLNARIFLNAPPGMSMGSYLCATSFLDEYVAAIDGRTWTVNTPQGPKTFQTTAFPNWLNRPDTSLATTCEVGSVYNTQAQKDNFLPCIDGQHVEGALRVNTDFSQSAYCAEFRNNQAFSGTPVQKDYATWLQQDCAPAGVFETTYRNLTDNLLIQDGSTGSFPMYLCPNYKRSFVRLPTGSSPDNIVKIDAGPAEAAYCYDPTRFGQPMLWSGRLTDGADANNTMEFSGDLLCQDDSGATYAPKIFPLITHADRVARNELFPSPPDSASELFDACLTELQAPVGTAGQNDGSFNGVANALQNLFPDANCVSVPRFEMAFDATFSLVNPPTIRDKKIFNHLLKQWIQVHSFLSYQGLQEARLRKVLASATSATTAPVTTDAPDPGTLDPINLEELITLVDESWERLLFVQDLGPTYLTDVVGTPDYRDWSGTLNVYSTFPERQAHQDQWVGLPAIILEGINQELRLLRAFLEDAALAAYVPDPTATNAARDAALGRYSDTMRLLYLVEGIANKVYGTLTTPPPWADRWNTARDELIGLREDVRRTAAALARGGNPLGIEEDDLPIFFGDPQGTNSRYFASSDYLVGQWAVPAVATAESSVALARDAWLQARNSHIQDRMTQTERDRRVDDIKAQQGQLIIDNCGLVGIDAQDVIDAMQPAQGAPTIAPETCFIDPACLARANLAGQDLTSKVSNAAIQYRLCTLNETAPYRNLPQPMAGCAQQGALVNGCTVRDLFNDFNSAQVTADASRHADLVCQARLGFRAPLPTAIDLVGSMDPSCYRGKLGATALQIISARQDIEIARDNWDAAEQGFKLDSAYCEQVEQSEDMAIDRANKLHDELDDLAEAKLDAEWAQTASDGFFGWAGQILSIPANPMGALGSMANGVGDLMDSSYKQSALLAQDAMDRAQRDYNEAIAIDQANDTIRACWHNVDKSQLGITAAYAQIARRGTDAMTAGEQLTTMMNENLQALRQGVNGAKREQNRYVGTVAYHYWLSDKVDRFFKDFAWAKRMTYLAMRAVEYEFQQTLPLRQAVLTASHPDQLQDAIRTLQQEVGTRTINRRRPDESSIVLSLRDDVLALPDHSIDAVGERRLTPTRGLQSRLTDPRFALHDTDGNWLGQGIPFNLGPEGVLADRCGERLWRVTATVQGDGLSDSQPGVPLFLLKRNTFASQWCEGHGDGVSRFQYGSLQPARRLFGESDTGSLESESNGFSTALIYPWFNIRRADFYKVAYQDGASEELAGRGLYGDYILLFPREVLEGTSTTTSACVDPKRGFPLDQVEDVLIRFDYLSVDNLPEIQQ
jgi:hypothetical protein